MSALTPTSTQPLSCSICLSNLERKDTNPLSLPCAHIFHRSCAKPWLENHSSCPKCRFKCEWFKEGVSSSPLQISPELMNYGTALNELLENPEIERLSPRQRTQLKGTSESLHSSLEELQDQVTRLIADYLATR